MKALSRLESNSLRGVGMVPGQESRWQESIVPWLRKVEWATVGCFYVIVVLQIFGFNSKLFDASLFFAICFILPIMCGFSKARRTSSRREVLITITAWVAVAAYLALLLAQLLASLSNNPAASWSLFSRWIIWLVPALHMALCLCVLVIPKVMRRVAERFGHNDTILYVAPISVLLLFWFDMDEQKWNGLVAYLRSDVMSSSSGPHIFAAALLSTLLVSILLVLIFKHERHAVQERRIGVPLRLALIGTNAILIFFLFFDYSLKLEVLHYLTNVGPALAVRDGRTPFVDSFSQYGLMPIILTYLAFHLGPITLGTAQLMVQLLNLAFYSIWLVCLYRMTVFKLPAMLLGILGIALLLAAWDFGQGNINVAPSILGLRYLPALLLVVSLSLLEPPRRHSWMSFASVFIAAIWSLETFLGTLAIYVSFLTALNLRDRAYTRILYDFAIALAPAAIALLTFSVSVALKTGTWPAYHVYLRFFSVYNPLSEYWSYPASAHFFGWITPALAVFLTVAESTRRTINGEAAAVANCPGRDALFHKFMPMAVLAQQTGAYFAFRSHDYTLATSLLPTLAIIIPGALSIISVTWNNHVKRLWLLIPAALCCMLATFSMLALGRANGPYTFYLQECRDYSRCSPTDVIHELNNRIHLRDLAEATGNPLSDRYIGLMKPSTLLHDVIDTIEKHSTTDHVTVLIGNSVVSTMVLMYTNRWQHWPISFLFTDQLVPELTDRIAAANVHIPIGDLVIVSSGLKLTPLEERIKQQLLEHSSMCLLPASYPDILAYRITGERTSAAQPQDAVIENCAI